MEKIKKNKLAHHAKAHLRSVSYLLALMVIHFFWYVEDPPVFSYLHEMYPEKFHPLLMSGDFGFIYMNEEIVPYAPQNTQTLGELYFSSMTAILTIPSTQYKYRQGPYCQRTAYANGRNYEEPFDLTTTDRSVYDCETFNRIKAVFIALWEVLQKTMALNTVFSPIAIDHNNNNGIDFVILIRNFPNQIPNFPN